MLISQADTQHLIEPNLSLETSSDSMKSVISHSTSLLLLLSSLLLSWVQWKCGITLKKERKVLLKDSSEEQFPGAMPSNSCPWASACLSLPTTLSTQWARRWSNLLDGSTREVALPLIALSVVNAMLPRARPSHTTWSTTLWLSLIPGSFTPSLLVLLTILPATKSNSTSWRTAISMALTSHTTAMFAPWLLRKSTWLVARMPWSRSSELLTWTVMDTLTNARTLSSFTDWETARSMPSTTTRRSLLPCFGRRCATRDSPSESTGDYSWVEEKYTRITL